MDRGDAPGWFARPIAWATEPGGRHVFVMVKQVVIPSTKVPWSPARAPLFVDGIPTGDPRTYRRFVDSNREGLSRERFREIVRLQARRDAVPTGAPKGVPIGVDRER